MLERRRRIDFQQTSHLIWVQVDVFGTFDTDYFPRSLTDAQNDEHKLAKIRRRLLQLLVIKLYWPFTK